MQRTILLCVDTYKSARNELTRLFNRLSADYYKHVNISSNIATTTTTITTNTTDNENTNKSIQTSTSSVIDTPAKMLNEVRRYLLHSSSKLKRSSSLAPMQSYVRGNVNLLLREARVWRNGPVALAALQVILSEERYIPNVEMMWLKDVLASCTSVTEVEQFKKLVNISSTSLSSPSSSSLAHTNEINNRSNNKLKSRINGDVASMLLGGLQLKKSTMKVLQLNSSSKGKHLQQQEQNFALEGSSNKCLSESELTPSAEFNKEVLLSSNSNSNSSNSTLQIQQHEWEQESIHELSQEMRKVQVAHALASHSPQPYAKSIYSPSERSMMGVNYLQHHSTNVNSLSVLTSPNQSFIRYFQKQGIVRNEMEVMSLFNAMQQRRLFESFRITSSQCSNHGSAQMLQTILAFRNGIERVHWLPVEFQAYVLNCSSDVNYDALLRHRQLLSSLAKERAISFQGISSMLPVLFLQPKLSDRILDMCAAPGGKTALILDILAFQEK